MNKYALLLFCFLIISSGLYAAPGHGGHGCHGHSGGHHGGGHAHVSHGGGHIYHYHSYGHHYSGGSRSGGGTGEFFPLSKVHELNGGVGTATYIESSDTNMCYCASKAALNINYKFFFSRRLAMGISGSMQSLGGESNYIPNATPYTFTGMNTTLAVDLTWLYMSREWCQIYGSLGAGVSHYVEKKVYDDNTARATKGDQLALQLSYLGIRIGRALGVFAELGVGYKGVINAGISWQMGRH